MSCVVTVPTYVSLCRHEIVNMNTKQKPDWFMKKNPNGTVPVLETASGQVIYESPITCEYLEEVYLEKKLCPADPFERAQNKMLLENYSKVGRLAFGIVCITYKSADLHHKSNCSKEQLCF